MAIMELEPLPAYEALPEKGKKIGLFVVDSNNVSQDRYGKAIWDEYTAERAAVDELIAEEPATSFIVSDTIWDRSEDFMKDLRFSSLIVSSQDEAASLLSTDTGLPVIVYLTGAHGNHLIGHLDEIFLVTLRMALPESPGAMTGPDLAGWTETSSKDGVNTVIRLLGDTAFMRAPTTFSRLSR